MCNFVGTGKLEQDDLIAFFVGIAVSVLALHPKNSGETVSNRPSDPAISVGG